MIYGERHLIVPGAEGAAQGRAGVEGRRLHALSSSGLALYVIHRLGVAVGSSVP
eukprot:COSAG02_NODE_7471_length_2997_cov_7.180124_2_plen_54_part_00